MKRNNKKGFTVVELVIVIAIIAILAGVLIPTFAGLIKKANTSADIQGCREMNTFLAVNEVTAGKNIVDVYTALEEGGMDAKDYTPLSSDTYYYWDSVLNRILYTDKNKNVIYPEEYKDVKSKDVDSTNGHQWYSLNGKIDTSNATVQIPTSAPSANEPTTLAAANAADLVKIAEYVRKYQSQLSENNNIEITITADMNLNGADIAFTEGNDSNHKPNVTIKGKDDQVYTITGLYISDKHSGLGYSGDGTSGNNYGGAMFGWVNNLTVKYLTIDSAVVGSYNTKHTAIFASHVTGNVEITNVKVHNSTVYGQNKTGLLFGYVTKDDYQVTITDVEIENSKVYSDQGECGLLFGVVTGNTQSTFAGSITLSDIRVTNSSASINPSVNTEEYDGKKYVHYKTEGEEKKYRIATATYGFYGLNQQSTYYQKSIDGFGTITIWTAINEVGTFNSLPNN